MKRIDITRKLTVLTLIFLFTVTVFAAAEVPIQNALSEMSGKVVDTAGKPVPECTFTLEPMVEFEGHLVPAAEFQRFFQELPEGMKQPRELIAIQALPQQVKTDSEGNFKISNIQPGFLRINFEPTVNLDPELADLPEGVEVPPEILAELQRQEDSEPDREFISIQFGDVTFLNDPKGQNLFQGFTFALKPGVAVENVKITVFARLQIQGHIVYADGTPLANAEVKFNILLSDERGNRRSTSTVEDSTDADGYFTIYRDDPGHYTVAIEYGNLSTGAGPFLLNDTVAPDKLVLKLDGNKADVAKPGNPDNVLAAEADGQLLFQLQEANSVWVINPANGHAYKKIPCEHWHDARQRAIKEEAHLVTINDEAEQHWLEGAFGSHSFWIGLTDVEKEGEWKWDGGEPVTYTNWTTFEIRPDRLPDTEKDYVILLHRDGKWQTTGPRSPSWEIARHAVIEKDGVLSTIPTEADNTDMDIDPTLESPFGFGPYPPIPDTWPADVKYWPCESAEFELMQRVRIKLASEEKEITGMTMKNGLVYINTPGTAYVEWSESGTLSGLSGDPKTCLRLQGIIKALAEQGKPFTEKDVPDDIKLVPHDEAGIDPYQFLGLPKND